MQIQILSPQNWRDYELIDCGGFEKLERFGKYFLARPEPKAMWDKKLSNEEWENMVHAYYSLDRNDSDRESTSDRGKWRMKTGMSENWFISYDQKNVSLKAKLALTSFGHVGIFPEQAPNWNFIFDSVNELKNENPRVLNLFAYTGVASLAARAAGAEVTHLDSLKQMIGWCRENMEHSGLKDIRWVVEDAMKFVKREVKRGNKYHGIIMDPPAYGRGPEGEKWILDDGINELIELSAKLLHREKNFFVLNMYSKGFSSVVAHTLLQSHFPKAKIDAGELVLESKTKQNLPLGVFARFTS